MKLDKNTILNISSGMIVGFTFQFVGFIIYDIIDNQDDFVESRDYKNDYIAAIITGFVGGLFINKISIFKNVFLSLAIYNGVLRSLNELDNRENLNDQEFMEKFIRDLLFIYLIRLIYVSFIENNIKRKVSINNETLNHKIKSSMLGTIPITIYLAFSSYYTTKIIETKNKCDT